MERRTNTHTHTIAAVSASAAVSVDVAAAALTAPSWAIYQSITQSVRPQSPSESMSRSATEFIPMRPSVCQFMDGSVGPERGAQSDIHISCHLATIATRAIARKLSFVRAARGRSATITAPFLLPSLNPSANGKPKRPPAAD